MAAAGHFFCRSVLVAESSESFRSAIFLAEHSMSPTPTAQVSDQEPGQLLRDLERRQDDVLSQLDALDAKLNEVLRGLGVTPDEGILIDLI